MGKKRVRCFKMDEVLPSQNTTPDPKELDSEQLQLKVDSFRKLGYSPSEVKAAFRKLGLDTDTNSVLGELVSSRTSSAPFVSETDEPPARFVKPSRLPPQIGDPKTADTELRPIIIDGSNVAISHGNKEVFSCRGIQLAVDFFLDRGHQTITVIVPSWRKEQPRVDAPITDQHILMKLEKQKIVVFTPSRRVGGKRVVCYDDRFIVKEAYESDGVIVSNDTYRDLQGERPEWKKCIEERLLMYSFVNDKFMPPDDPLGRHGPTLDNFLRKKPLPVEHKRQLCPYDKKCTYGIKCKFFHPERANQSYLSLADELREKAHISTVKEERNAKQPSRKSQPEHKPTHNAYSHHLETKLPKEPKNSSHLNQVSENYPSYWEEPRNSPNHMPSSVTGNHNQKECLGSHMNPNNYHANMSQEYLDSGFSSFESHYSDISHSSSNSHRLLPQHRIPCTGLQHASLPLERNNAAGSCRCCSHVHQLQQGKLDCKHVYDTYPSHMFPTGVHHQHSLPTHFHYGVPHPQQNYWSDPCQGLPQADASRRLPALVPRSNSSCYYQDHHYQTWSQQPPPPVAAEPQRSELRKKLQAIFNPHQVDVVMKMFPDLMDAEKLAAEIFKLKAQGVIY